MAARIDKINDKSSYFYGVGVGLLFGAIFLKPDNGFSLPAENKEFLILSLVSFALGLVFALNSRKKDKNGGKKAK